MEIARVRCDHLRIVEFQEGIEPCSGIASTFWEEAANVQWTPGGMSGDMEDRRNQGGGGRRGVHLGLGGYDSSAPVQRALPAGLPVVIHAIAGRRSGDESERRSYGGRFGPAKEHTVRVLRQRMRRRPILFRFA